MAKFRKGGKKEVPQVSTSSLPDIVYMLIFFFMITTTMRDVELKVKTAMPKASEIQKLEHKALVSSIYIGPPRDAKLGTESRIQLDDAFARPADIADWVQKERDSRSEADKPLLTFALVLFTYPFIFILISNKAFNLLCQSVNIIERYQVISRD